MKKFNFENPVKEYLKERGRYTELSTEGSDVVNFFKGKNIFLTGASGFLGKLLVEKLLRCCKDLDGIYILCREKKGKDMHTRVDEILNDIVYERLAQVDPKFRHKVIAVKGDISLPGLGMTLEDREILTSKVNIIFHVAATIRFDERIKMATRTNVCGTKEMLELGRECKKLESFVYVSTAFSNCNRKEIDEIVYDVTMKADDLINYVENKSDKELDQLTPKILGAWPNTYVYTKAIAESVVRDYWNVMPVCCICRPSIVLSTYQEPIRNWIDNIYGPTGVILGTGLGMLKTIHCDGNNMAEVVPGDMVINQMICAAYETALKKSPLKVYNYVSTCQNPQKWKEFLSYNTYYGNYVPTTKALWYGNIVLNKYEIVHWFYCMLLHAVPALLVDIFRLFMFRKPQMLKLCFKMQKFLSVTEFFSCRAWNFTNKNTRSLWKDLNDVDQALFPFDVDLIDWERHAQMNALGIRLYIVKDDISTLPEARKKWNRLWILHNALKGIFVLIACRILYGILNLIFN